ncbi:MAG: sigma-54 dependent transcriptional regulator [Spirochaetes bacterium]|jgi:two-component system response regulator AtoC|nr:sigma-54 dependent transcriptional regulator [Spirochaetota bacterium]
MKKLLIIDDNEKLCISLKRNFDQRGFNADYATNSSEVHTLINRKEYSAVLLDIVFGSENGIDVLNSLMEKHPSLPVIMITGFATIESAVTAIKNGAFDYIQKPLNFDKLMKIVENAIKVRNLEKENDQYRKVISSLTPKVITKNLSIIKLYERAACLAKTDIAILITGENGTGKELLADYIHTNSLYANQKIVKINCAAFPDNLLDNELFGHEKGAYTGATTAYTGVFERANNSSLMLDEIGDMELATQAKILRAIQNKEIKRIGGSDIIKIKVRFIAATNKNLKKMIDENSFRSDLFYRLNAATLHLPPLRERKDDISLLVKHFLQEFSSIGDKTVTDVSDKVMNVFLDYQWPGNIRELKNAIMYGAALTQKKYIEIDDLPPVFEELPESEKTENILDLNEKNIILEILNKTNNNKKKTAEILNISRRTLYNKIEKYGIKI